jgi:cytochrome bd ubiquinol oxidase subunit I
MLIAEGMHLRTGDPVWRALARRWSKVFAVLFAVGAVSGTIISFELGLLWPRFMAYAGGIIGLPFSLEGAAFFIEAIFVGIYLYGWDRLPPRLHWLSGIPIALASVGSAFFIVTANAWMNAPSRVPARPRPCHPCRPTGGHVQSRLGDRNLAHGSPRVPRDGVWGRRRVRDWHARGHRDAYHRKAIAVAMSSAAILAPLQVGVGDLLGRTVAHNQPAKLAAIEGVTKTEHGAGLNVGGIPVPGHVPILNVKIPHLLSVLAFDRPNATVRGLNSFPKADRPPLAGPVRLAVIGMVGIGTGLVAIGLFYWLRRRRNGPGPEDRITLIALAVAGPLAFLANELGWMVSELGWQPWVVYGFLRTSNAITTASGLGATFTAFTFLYITLTGLTIWARSPSCSRPSRPPSQRSARRCWRQLTLALLAVVLRGAAFGLRSSPDGVRRSDARLGRVFGIASAAAPLLFGSIAGGLAQVSSSRHAAGDAVPSIPWTGVFALVVGVLAVALCTQLAASFLTVPLVRLGRRTRAEHFRLRAMQSGGAVVVLSIVALIVGNAEAPAFSHRLLGTALPAVIVALLALATALLAFRARGYRLARWATVIGAGALIWGWIIAQAPHLIGQLTIRSASASHSALTAVAVAVGIVLMSVLAAMYLLFTMFARPLSEETQ